MEANGGQRAPSAGCHSRGAPCTLDGEPDRESWDPNTGTRSVTLRVLWCYGIVRAIGEQGRFGRRSCGTGCLTAVQLGSASPDRDGVEPVNTPYRTPNANAHAERWVLSARAECLDHLILFGIKSLRRVARAFLRFHNERRPRQGIGNRVPRSFRTGERGRRKWLPGEDSNLRSCPSYGPHLWTSR